MRSSIFVASFVVVAMFPWTAPEAKDFVFDVSGTTIIPGSGAQVIKTFDPQQAAVANTQGPAIEKQLQPNVDQLVTQLKQQVAARLDPLDFGPAITYGARGQTAAVRAPTVDYASWMKVAGLSVQTSAAMAPVGQLQSTKTYLNHVSENLQEGHAPPFGGGATGAVSLGLSLAPFHLKKVGFFDPSRLSLFASALAIGVNSGAEITTSTRNFGLFAKYELLSRRALLGTPLLRWGGLNVTSGISYARLGVTAHPSLPGSTMTQPETINGQTINVQAKWEGQADIRLVNEIYTIPIEAATSIELLWAFTFYGGIGVDFNFGHARLTANARAPVQVAAVSTDGSKSVTLATPLPTLAYDQTRKPQVSDVRGFAGLQLGAGAAGIFAHVAIDTSQTAALALGARLFW